MKIKVVNEWDTIKYIVHNKVGISRYGDGEIKLIKLQKTKPQLPCPKLSKRLKQILVTDNPNCIVGIPNAYEGVHAEDPKSQSFWENTMKKKEYYDYLDPNRTYYSSFITRPDNTTGINNWEYFNLCKEIWKDRDIVIVLGETLSFSKNPILLDNCRIRGEVRGPLVNAWFEYDRILKECKKYPKDTLFLIRLGPTATVLAWDLCLEGYQALDLGHLPMFFRRFTDKQPDEWDYNHLHYSYSEEKNNG